MRGFCLPRVSDALSPGHPQPSGPGPAAGEAAPPTARAGRAGACGERTLPERTHSRWRRTARSGLRADPCGSEFGSRKRAPPPAASGPGGVGPRVWEPASAWTPALLAGLLGSQRAEAQGGGGGGVSPRPVRKKGRYRAEVQRLPGRSQLSVSQ